MLYLYFRQAKYPLVVDQMRQVNLEGDIDYVYDYLKPFCSHFVHSKTTYFQTKVFFFSLFS